MRVYADAGHGGPDRGGNGLVDEANTNLDIMLHAERVLVAYGVEVIPCRRNDNITNYAKQDLIRRTNEANAKNTDCYVSIHNNSMGGSGKAAGTETFVQQGNKNSQLLGKLIQKAVVDVMKRPDRGIFTRDFDDERIYALGSGQDPDIDLDYYHVLREAKMPAVIVECGFMDNRQDADLLANAVIRKHLGEVIAAAIIEWGIAIGLLASPKPQPKAGATPLVVFPDIEGYWGEETIEKAYEMGLVKGKDGGVFDPNGSITRGEAVILDTRVIDYLLEKLRKAGINV